MSTSYLDGEEERIQRTLNEAKRAELAERFGMVFGQVSEDLPAEIEAEFLQNVEAFEIQWAAAQTTTVRSFVGDPAVRPPADVPAEEIADELDRLLGILSDNNLCLDVLSDDVPAEELYRFIVEELLDHEVDDIRVPGMAHHFIYEEFHPNLEYDARMVAEWFLDRLFYHSEYVLHEFAHEGLLDAQGNAVGIDEYERLIETFRREIAAVIEHTIEVTGCDVRGDSAVVRAQVTWRGLAHISMNEQHCEGDAEVTMRRGPAGDWEIVRFSVPGVNDPASMRPTLRDDT